MQRFSGTRQELAQKTTEQVTWSHLRQLRDLPTFPTIVGEVNDLLMEPDVSAADLSDVICRDPTMAAKLLRLVNTAYYGFSRQINSVSHAINMLGLDEVQSLALAAAVMGMWDENHGNRGLCEFLWQHSIETGRIAKAIAAASSVPVEVDDVFICGLLHDIGKIVLEREFPNEYADIAEIQTTTGQQTNEVELDLLSTTHEEVGAWLLDRWQLPHLLVEAVRWHHDPDNAERAPVVAKVLKLADALTQEREIQPDLIESLGLTEAQVAEIVIASQSHG